MFRSDFEDDLLFKELEHEIFPIAGCAQAILNVLHESNLQIDLPFNKMEEAVYRCLYIYIELVDKLRDEYPQSMPALIAVELLARLKAYIDYFPRDFVFNGERFEEMLLPVVVVVAKYVNDESLWTKDIERTHCWSQTQMTLGRLVHLEKTYLKTISYSLHLSQPSVSNTYNYLSLSMFYRPSRIQRQHSSALIGFEPEGLKIIESPDARSLRVRESQVSILDDSDSEGDRRDQCSIS